MQVYFFTVLHFQAESDYRQVQEQRRATQLLLTSVQSRIKDVAMEIEKTQRGTDAYLNLVTKENEIIKEEKDVLDQLTASEENEKRFFGLLSSALRESHEKERARAERMKYWGIMGSIIGAVIGIFGTTVNNYLRMKELRGIVTNATEMNQVYKDQTMNLYVSVNEQYGKIYQFLSDIRSAAGLKPDVSKVASKETSAPNSVIDKDSKLEELTSALKHQEEVISKEIQKLGNVLAAKDGRSVEGPVVYIGPEVESMLKESERNLEWKMKMQSLGTVTLIYALAAVSIPIVWKLFGGS